MSSKNDEDKHGVIDAALNDWRQGDCCIAEGQWFVYRFAPPAPLTNEAVAAADHGVSLAEVEVPGFVVLSQTCDIVRKCSDRPFLEVAPLVSVDDSTFREIKRRLRPRYVWIPAFEDRRLVADLDRVMTMEKGVVAAWKRIPGYGDNDDSDSIRQALARKFTRFAFPNDFIRVAGGLLDRIREKHDRQSDEGADLRALREIRVDASPSWGSDSINLLVHSYRRGRRRPQTQLERDNRPLAEIGRRRREVQIREWRGCRAWRHDRLRAL